MIFRFLRSKYLLPVSFVLALGNTPSYASDTANGSKIYSTHCIACHGTSGISVMVDTPNFSKGEGLLVPDTSLLFSIKNGKNAMPGYQGILTDSEILDVIAYLRTLF